MNGWYFGATVAARERMKDFRRQADDARAARNARHRAPALGGLVLARRRVATVLYRLADALAPQSLSGPETMRGARDVGGRPVV